MAVITARRNDIDMTTGNIRRHLIAFAVPLLIGSIFQQLYNTVDSIVVGNFVGKEALAAVGSVGPIINTLIGFFLGLSTGASVVISQYFGAHDDKSVSDAVQTTMLLTFFLCVVFTAIGVLMVPYMLRFMSTPDDVFNESAQYLRIYFYGVAGLMVYNMGSAVLRAVGDSKRPLYFLIFSAVVNTVLDLVFVVAFKWGIAGVAIATVIAQCLSSVLVLIVLTRSNAAYRIVWRRLRIVKPMLARIWKIGLPAALQQAITSFSNVFVQSYINNYGSACMAGWSSYAKVDQFAVLPTQALAMATTTFVGQNLGAGQPKRAREGTNKAFLMSFCLTVVLIIPLMVFAPQLISLFNKDPEVLSYGTLFMRMISPFYLIWIVDQIYSSCLRGAGDTRAPMIIMLGSFVVFRQIYLYATSKLFGTVISMALGYPAGWLICSIAMIIYYKRDNWEKKFSIKAKS